MDPNLVPEQPDFPEGSGPTEDGASHLLRLKRQGTGASSEHSADAGPEYVGTAEPAPEQKERRRSIRFACSGSVELRAEDNRVQVWGTLSDISLHGCYVEMSATLPVNTKVNLAVDSLGIRFQAPAKVVTSHLQVGMGMCYADIDPEQQSQLKLILANLAHQRALINTAPSEQIPPLTLPKSVDSDAWLQGVAEFFKKNRLLSRDEFYQIAKRARRS